MCLKAPPWQVVKISQESTLLDHDCGQDTRLNTIWQLIQSLGSNNLFKKTKRKNISHRVRYQTESDFFSTVRDIDGINTVLPRHGGLPFRAVVGLQKQKTGLKGKRNRGTEWSLQSINLFWWIWGEKLDQSQGLRCSSSIWRLLVGHRRGWLEQFVLWLFRLSVDSDDPGEEDATDKQHGTKWSFQAASVLITQALSRVAKSPWELWPWRFCD